MKRAFPATGAVEVQHPTPNSQHPASSGTACGSFPAAGRLGRWTLDVGCRVLKRDGRGAPDRSLPPASAPRAGFTLVEVLLASLILGIGLTVLMSSLSTCLRTMRLARDYEQVQWVLGLGELAYPEPIATSADVKTDYTVEPDDSLCEGFTFERVVDEKTPEEEEKDKLYVVRTRILWGEAGDNGRPSEELVRYVWQRDK